MLKLTTAAAAVVIAAGAAQAAVIDFEGFGHGEAVNSVTVAGVTAAISVASNGAVDQAVAFDTGLTGTADPDLEAPFGGSGSEFPGNILIISEDGGADDERLGGIITLNFSQPIDFVGFSAYDGGFFEVRSARGDVLLGDEVIEVAGDNLSNALVTEPGTFQGVSTLEFLFMNSGEGASGGIDDIEFNVSVAPIPVPAALPLLAAGLGGLVLVSRRRRG